MDATETHFALREARIALVLSEDRNRLICEPAGALTTPLAEAFAANHDYLLKEELLKELVRFVTRRISEREGTRPAELSTVPAASAAFDSMAASQERIAAALETEDVTTFKATLRHYGRTALRLHQSARAVDGHPAPVESPAADSAEPGGREPDPRPVQESLLG